MAISGPRNMPMPSRNVRTSGSSPSRPDKVTAVAASVTIHKLTFSDSRCVMLVNAEPADIRLTALAVVLVNDDEARDTSPNLAATVLGQSCSDRMVQ